MLSFLWIICGPPFVSYVEPFDYFGSQIHSCLQTEKNICSKCLSFLNLFMRYAYYSRALKNSQFPEAAKEKWALRR